MASIGGGGPSTVLRRLRMTGCSDLALPHLVKLKAIIFDIDGTLVDSNDAHVHCWIEAFAHFGKQLAWDVVRHQIGKGGDLLVPDLLNAREMRRFGEKLKKFRTDLYKRNYMQDVKPFPRVREHFETLRGRGIKLALGSSSNQDEVQYYTELLGVGDLVEGSTSKQDADLSKPSPEIFQAALGKLGTAANNTLTVGDTPYDILASHRASLAIAAVLSGGFERELLTKAEFLFDDVGELVRKIDRIDEYFNNE
jgi:HAD superfamily hydrolase (TIGR01549 family)